MPAPRLRLTERQFHEIVAHCFDGMPDEACGLLAGPVDRSGEPVGGVTAVYPCTNADASARTYTVDSRDHIRALRDAESRGEDLVGVFHSHTHSEPYPSETDVRSAVEPAWFYAIVSFKRGEPILAAYRLCDGRIDEVPIEIGR